MKIYPNSVNELINQFKKLPGIGPKSSERIVTWLLQNSNKKKITTDLSQACLNATENAKLCKNCNFFTEDDLCLICNNSQRNINLIAVVEDPQDIIAIEKSRGFEGVYHCLGGKLSPLNNVGYEDLKISELITRLKKYEIDKVEIIISLSSNIEGETTSNFIHNLLKKTYNNIKITRLAFGLPVIGGLENADNLSIIQALKGRKVI